MFRIVALLVLCFQALSQPLTDEPSTRVAPQVTECCPCPGFSHGGQDTLVGRSQLASADESDDCPCQPRSSDSDGASSFLFPSTAVLNEGSLMRQNDLKEDSRNLLEPEVTLATSMLDTLREATEEGYRDALARDAAKSATEPDALPEESARNVVFLVKPRNSDDFISEASHVQESRCIYPLEATSLGKIRNPSKPNDFFHDTLSFSKLKHPGILNRKLLHMDSDLGASNVQESTVEINENTPFQTHTPTLELWDPFQRIIGAHSFRNSNSKPGKIDGHELSFPKGLKFPLLPKLKQKNKMFSNDNLTPNNMQEQSEAGNESDNQSNKHSKLPLNITKLLKLRDVELVPKSILNKQLSKPNADMSTLEKSTVLKRNQNINNFEDNCENPKHDGKSEIIWNNQKNKIDALRTVHHRPLNLLKDYSSSKLKGIFDNDSERKLTEENLDTMVSPSQIQLSIVDHENKRGLDATLQYTLENDVDCNFLEPRDLKNGIINQIKENQDESKEIIYDSDKPETISVSGEETSNENYDQDVEVGDVLQNRVLNLNKDLETDSSNKAHDLIYFETQGNQVTDLLSHNQENSKEDEESTDDQEISDSQDTDDEMIETQTKSLENIKMVPELKTFPPLSETLSNLQENVVRKYNNFKRPSIFNSDLSKMSHNSDKLSVSNESEGDIHDRSHDQTLEHYESNEMITNLHATDTEKSGFKVTINDLQNMSDNLLGINASLKAAKCDVDSNEINIKSNELGSTINKKTSNINLEPINLKENIINDDKNHKYVGENSCSTISNNYNTQEGQEKIFKSASQETAQKEMDTGASDTIITALEPFNLNSKMRSPLLESIGVHTPQDPLSLLRKPLGDVLNLNTNLPTLEDLRERLTNIVNPNDRSTEDDSSSIEGDSSNVFPLDMMAPEASTMNSRIKIPPLKQFKDYNEGIFRNRPITTSPIDTLTPRLNLNSYLPQIPKLSKLGLKPVKIESGLGAARKVKPSNAEVRLKNFPSLDDTIYNLRLNPKDSLISSSRPDLNLFTNDFRSSDIGDIAETIRLNMQNTMKSLRQKMKSTLRKTKTYNQIGEPLAKPQELLDDVNDKLKGIHYDLNDRISCIHDNIMDSPQIKTLMNQSHKLANKNDLFKMMTDLRQKKAKPLPLRLQKAASTMNIQKINPHDSKQRDSPNTEPRRFIDTARDKSHNTQVGAESAPVPIRIEMPESLSYLEKPTLLRQNPTMTEFLRERKPFSALIREPINFRDGNGPVFRTPVRPFKNQPERVTITFDPMTPQPTPSPRPILTPRAPTIMSPQFEEHSQSIFSRANDESATERGLVYHTLKSAEETEILPSEFKSLRSSAQVPSNDKKLENHIEDKHFLKKYPMTSINWKPSLLREMASSTIQGKSNRYKSANIFDENRETMISSARRSSEETSVWPKVNERAFSSKIRDSVNTRLSNRDPKPYGVVETDHKINSDMIKSPSENTQVILDEPLKENVSYKCRMVCTKVRN